MRVVSFLPSATEIMCAVGGGGLMVGRSHECDFPAAITHLPTLTGQVHAFESSRQMNDAVSASLAAGKGLYTIDSAAVEALRPKLILTQSLCNVCSVDLGIVERAVAGMEEPPQILSLNPNSLRDILDDMLAVGEAAGLSAEAAREVASLERRIQACLDAVKANRNGGPPKKVAFVEWLDPIFVGGHWTPALIEMAGGCHPLNPPTAHASGAEEAAAAGKSFAVPTQQLVDMDPDIIIVCPCGLDMKATMKEASAVFRSDWWLGLRAVQAGEVVLVDGNQMFNRPGPRLVDGLEFLTGLLNNAPELIPSTFPWQKWTAEAVEAQLPSQISNGRPEGEEAGGDILTCYPPLSADIEDVYQVAVESGASTYIDPSTGYSVLTEKHLRGRGHCCGNRCRHCPYGHYNVDTSLWGPRRNRVITPMHLDPMRGPAVSPDGQEVTLLVWTGGLESHLALQTLRVEPLSHSQLSWGAASLPLHDVLEQVKRLKARTVVVPLEQELWDGPQDLACLQVLNRAAAMLGQDKVSLAYAVPSLPHLSATASKATTPPPPKATSWEELQEQQPTELPLTCARPSQLLEVGGAAVGDGPRRYHPMQQQHGSDKGEGEEGAEFTVEESDKAGEGVLTRVLTQEMVAAALDG
eukprot:CAMPEP_0177785240 /NCGR_PEP_ID=MMETSP0491_2-20121128/20187_1 /TAXON_ID=63592 /ORGANISM="Tetraselmis chuii, Strain PLY429" /LENGTH=636 /DNA_ID=CAMNT_0019306177 /DNA_START=349 /DNA_END=2255 /DNA_ORIENTATION=-